MYIYLYNKAVTCVPSYNVMYGLTLRTNIKSSAALN